MQGVTEHTEQKIKLIISLDRVLTSFLGFLIFLKALLQGSFAFGIGEFHSCFMLPSNGTVGLALKLMTAVKQSLKLMELITHPESILASGLIAGFKTDTPIRSHAKTMKAISAERFKMSFPSLGRAI